MGCAIAQVVSHWLPTSEAQVSVWGSPCGIFGEQCGTGTGFSPISAVCLLVSFF
jgi:hypothetical protein